MNSIRLQILKQQEGLFKFIINILNGQRFIPIVYCTTTLDAFDGFSNTNECFQNHKYKLENPLDRLSIRRFSDTNTKPNTLDVSQMNNEELDDLINLYLLKNKDKQIVQIIEECVAHRKLLSDKIVKSLLREYSKNGRTDMVVLIQNYSLKVSPDMFKRNGEFLHYYAKAQCLRGNSEKGLSVLKECYSKYYNFRGFYRVLFRELIQDSVLNRSEASLVIFKKYVIEFSKEWDEHYPLVCFWHICWTSSWYSDQMISNELWDASEQLRKIVQKKVTALSISALRTDYNEDAVIRLLQALLKYKMMAEYTSVLQVLFDFKLKNRDQRGCTEIIRNCEVLGITLTPGQQGKYIKMLIYGKLEKNAPAKLTSKEFKLKF